ncbi:prolyl oligopeptidase family serine peptidase [Sphingobacterium sp. DK4209]|uniref:Prolyl oligopeptidase family serine peptidase n=1 Tax=Sphingobacterium zhuxiongii TaxID=2662364 RepID=A0A5Q0Q9Q1_9SPHI|nr:MULTISPECIES: DPP IV N-terminal domain-containing protein [unclassified Sphingobacterium]MVZ65209.1 prolyl oligopeptidase family serine peptidase [Sphingobacterium sp. DK4209]QGA26156.1 prolyl oligopeptidase family serine peptidase [Sphingobacterium sp. dk4302]
MRKLLILFLLSSSMAYGQRNFSIDETVFGPGKFAPKTIYVSKWIKNVDAFSSLDSTYQNLLVRDAKNNWQAKQLISKSDLQNALAKAISTDKIELRRFPSDYQWIDVNNIAFQIEGEKNKYQIKYDLSKKQVTVLNTVPSELANTMSNASQNKTAYLNGNNIEIIDATGNKIVVTKDTVDGIVNGSEVVHRNEFGIDQGMWWSANDKLLLYYRKDESMVTKYPLPQWDSRVATVKDIRYPMAGMKSEEVTLNIFNTETGETIRLQTGEPKEQYLTIVTWDPSSEFVYVGVLNRGQDHLKLNKYNANTGAFISTLFEEQSTTWVEPQHTLAFVPNKANQFLYQTDKDGFNQLFLYDTQGKLIRKLGYQDVVVTDFQGFNTKGTKAYYIGANNNGLERHLFEVDLQSGKTTALTHTAGTHNASISTSGNYVLDQYSNLSVPNKVQVINRKGNQSSTILEAGNPFTGKIALPKIELKSFTSADGKTPLNARILYPNNFDPTKKYPVMVYLYGGSHAQLVTDKWLGAAGYFDLYMAQQGYIVFTLDNRGSDARGRDFTRVTHRNLGEAEMADQLVGINYLKSLAYVDSENMGIFGWSFGGFMSSSFMTKHNDIFKAAVAGGPVIDWKYYEIMYGERYMDTPEENPEGYEKTSMLNKADQLKGHLLIIHGAQDPVVVQQHSMEFVQKCIEAGKQVDYFLYPTHEHNVMGKDRIHMYDKIAKYFDQYLKK